MSVLGDVFDSLRAMSLLQLLLAFVACIGYSVAQGALVSSPRVRGFAAMAAFVGAVGYAVLGTEWMHAAMLVAFGAVGMGLFVSAVWLTSRVLGFVGARSADADSEPSTGPRSSAARHSASPPTEHAHSI